MLRDEEVVIRPIAQQDLTRLWELIYRDEAPKWKQWDAPYFKHETMTYEQFREIQDTFLRQEQRWVIEVSGIVHGTVSYYYEDSGKNWLEIGIALHQSDRWNNGVGTRALRLWVQHLFDTLPLARVGLTTWSGNERMMRVAEKVGMQLEGRIRRVRVVDGKRYDSIRMGMLREEWDEKSVKAD